MSVQLLNHRELEILYHVAVFYLETGRPVASKGLAERLNFRLSAASIRSVMAGLEERGLLFAPHTSAGRLPTSRALKFVIDRLLEYHHLSADEKEALQVTCNPSHKTLDETLKDISLALAGLSACVAIVSPGNEYVPLKKIDVVLLQPGRGLFMVLSCTGQIRQCMISLPELMTSDHLVEMINYLNSHVQGTTLEGLQQKVMKDIQSFKTRLKKENHAFLAQNFVHWCEKVEGNKGVIVRGKSQFLRTLQGFYPESRIVDLIDLWETEDRLSDILQGTDVHQGTYVQVGDHTEPTELCFYSFVIAPYKQPKGYGRVGVMGPTHMDYRRIVPMVDYTARLLERIVDVED